MSYLQKYWIWRLQIFYSNLAWVEIVYWKIWCDYLIPLRFCWCLKISPVILYYEIQSVCVCVCVSMWVCMLVRNRLQNHAYYGDEAFAGDSVGLGLGQRLNLIFKKLILRYFCGKIAPDEKKYCLHINQVPFKSSNLGCSLMSNNWATAGNDLD